MRRVPELLMLLPVVIQVLSVHLVWGIQHLLRDECITENAARGLSTYEENITLHFASFSSLEHIEIRLMQGLSTGRFGLGRLTYPFGKWHHATVILKEHPELLFGNERLLLESSVPFLRGQSWYLEKDDAISYFGCPGNTPIFEMRRYGRRSVRIPRSENTREELKILPIEDTVVQLTVRRVRLTVCRQGERVVVLKHPVDTSDCQTLIKGTTIGLNIDFTEDNSVKITISGQDTSTEIEASEINRKTFNGTTYGKAYSESIEFVAETMPGAVLVIQCLDGCPHTPLPTPTPRDIHVTGACISFTVLTVLTSALVFFVLITFVFVGLLVYLKRQSPSHCPLHPWHSWTNMNGNPGHSNEGGLYVEPITLPPGQRGQLHVNSIYSDPREIVAPQRRR